MFGGARGEFCHAAKLRLRTPDVLNERGRAELTGTKDREAVREKGSEYGVELKDVEALISAIGGAKTCDCDIGVPSDISDSLSAIEGRSFCNGAFGVRSGF